MALGQVNVNNLNLSQGSFDEVERKALFIGPGDAGTGTVIALNSQSNLDDLLGTTSSQVKTQVEAAQANGGENWQAWAAPLDVGTTWEEALDMALQSVSPELVVVCTPAASKAEVEAAQTKAESVRTNQARRIIVLMAAPGIDPLTETWGDYVTGLNALVDTVSAYRVAVVPLLHGNDLGALAGRLCNRAVSIADSPMRVATGPVLSLGATPQDINDDPLDMSTLASLEALRLSVPQTYPDYPGTFWGDCNLLDADGGDYQVIENLRVVDKAARAVRVLAIARIADRGLNSTPVSIASNKTYFSRPLREMARGVTFGGTFFPGEIQAPADGDVEIIWPSANEVEVYISVKPYNAPKKITANIALDLNANG